MHYPQAIPSTSKATDSGLIDDPANFEEFMPELSESDFELADSDVHTSDSEWSSNDDVALKILDKRSKYAHQSMSSDEDDELIPLAALSRKGKGISTKGKKALDDVRAILDSLIANIPVDSIPEANVENIQQETRPLKRKGNESEWRQKKAKLLRNSGKSYISKKGVERKARQMGPGCGQKCRNRCQSKISLEDRQTLFHGFWELADINRQRDFIIRNVNKCNKNRNACLKNRRNFSYVYSFHFSGKRTVVCKTFFLHTLDISAQMVETAYNNQSTSGIVDTDQRGKMPSSNRLEDERRVIAQHINSFPRVPSHYCRKDTDKEYLDSNMSREKMYLLYRESRESNGQKPASKWVYLDVLKTFNISFHQRTKDQCPTCTSYNNSDGPEKEKMQEMFDEHIKEKESVYRLKSEAKQEALDNDTHASAVFDLEEVLTTPKLLVGDAYYMRKLGTYNLTVYNYGSKEVFCYLWPEFVASRGSNEVSSCVFDYIKTMAGRNVKTFTLLSDSCGGQNKNRTMVFMLWYALNKFNLVSIKHQFLVVGHTFNEGDSAHSSIENASRKIEIYTPSQWAATIRTASRKRDFIVKEQMTSDFVDFKEMAKCLPNLDLDEERNRVKWMSIRSLELTSSEPDIVKIRYCCDGEVIRMNVNKRMKRSTGQFQRVTTSSVELKSIDAVPISEDKYKDLCKMCDKNFIPKAHHDFFRNLPHV